MQKKQRNSTSKINKLRGVVSATGLSSRRQPVEVSGFLVAFQSLLYSRGYSVESGPPVDPLLLDAIRKRPSLRRRIARLLARRDRRIPSASLASPIRGLLDLVSGP